MTKFHNEVLKRRRSVRVSRNIPVELKFFLPEEKTWISYKAKGKNISKGGIFVEIPESRNISSLLESKEIVLKIELAPSATEVETHCHVVWSKTADSTLQAGFRFHKSSLDENLNAYIKDLVTTKEKFQRWNRNPFLRLESFLYEKIGKKIMPAFGRWSKPLVQWTLLRWLGELKGRENIPFDKGCILIANHASYFDFLLISSFIKKWVHFLATRKLSRHPIMKYFMYYNFIHYIDRDNPGVKYFKEVMWALRRNNIVVFFPEGMRSPNGNIQRARSGFVKLAIAAKVPIVPLAFSGTAQVLPKHALIPRMKKADVFVGCPIYLDKYYHKSLDKEEIQKIADKIMKKIEIMAKEKRLLSQDECSDI